MALNTGRPVRLPYEVFLNIIDAFINEAESEALFIGLNFFVEDEEFVVDYNLPIDRFGLGFDSKNSKKTRSVLGSVSLDHFTAGSIEALLDLDTVMETSSVKCIEILDDMTSEIFDEETEEAADNIFSLPNLREVKFSLGFHDSECSMAESDEEPDEESFPMAMDGEMFDLLSVHLWREPWIYGHAVKSFLCQASTKGVAVFGWRSHDGSHHDKVIEISCPQSRRICA